MGKVRKYDFDLALTMFTPGMAKRAGQVFAGAPMIQGKWDGSGTPDVLSFSRGSQIASNWYANFDPYQGGGFCEWTPEQSTGDSTGMHYLWYASAAYYLAYDYDNDRYQKVIGTQTLTVAAVLVAGTPEILAWGFDSRNTLDGTNYGYFSRNNVQTFGLATQPTASIPDATLYVGSNGSAGPLNGIPEGLVFVREIPWTGAFGTDMGAGDVVTAHYAAGAGADIAETIGAWGTTFSLPTDSAVGALTTGTGEAWSMPHAANLLTEPWLTDGYGPDQQWCLTFDGSGDWVDCGSAAALDDLPDGADATFECWARWDVSQKCMLSKGNDTTGWTLVAESDGDVTATLNFDNTDASITTTTTPLADNKWHHIALDWDWGALTAELYIDGLSYGTDTAIGNYVADAALAVRIGSYSDGTLSWDGQEGWARLSDSRRYTADFIPSRTMPAADGNTVDQWGMADGSGATVAASVTSPGNDGTITGATWAPKWANEGTPVDLQGIEYNGTTTSCVVADAAAIQDLHDAAMTAEAWVRTDGWGEANEGHLLAKNDGIAEGWRFFIDEGLGLRIRIYAATTNGDAISGTDEFSTDGRLHHVCAQFDDGGDRKPYLWIDGVPVTSYISQIAAVDAVVTDVGNDLYIGNRSDGANTFDGLLGGWARLSNVLRYTNGKVFVPAPPTNPPAPDGNTAWQTDYSDGAGATLTDDSGNANNGTLSNHVWKNTRDLADAQGEQNYEWGYILGNDGANEGMTQLFTGVTPGDDAVVRTNMTPSADGTARMFVRVYDEIGAANIVDFYGPRYVGTHTGANNSAALIDAGARWMQYLVGILAYNVTDGSVATVTAIDGTGTIITGALAGGTDNDWDTGDVYRIVWPYASGAGGFVDHPWVETFCFELPAGCTSYSVKYLNAAATGTFFCQQIEAYESLVTNGGLETGAGNPWVPTGWAVGTMGAGDTQASSTGGALIHSGGDALQLNAGADITEHLYANSPFVGADNFSMAGYWGYGVCRVRFEHDAQATGVTLIALATAIAGAWSQAAAVLRATDASDTVRVYGKGATRYVDDLYYVALAPVSLTVTPANEANSAESGGRRTDGRDMLTQPIPVGYLRPRKGHIRWRDGMRHSPANLIAFRETTDTYAAYFFGDATNYISLRATAANQFTLSYDAGGAGIQTVNWACAAEWTEDQDMLFEILYRANLMRLRVDGIFVAAIAQPVVFTTIPTLTYWGSNNAGARQLDAVYLDP